MKRKLRDILSKEEIADLLSIKFALEGVRVCSIHCYNFIPRENGEEREVTAIIAPITLTIYDSNRLGISWACNHGPFCYNNSCRYARPSIIEE